MADIATVPKTNDIPVAGAQILSRFPQQRPMGGRTDVRHKTKILERGL